MIDPPAINGLPASTENMFCPCNSYEALDAFLKRNKLSHVIRAHECKAAGFQVCSLSVVDYSVYEKSTVHAMIRVHVCINMYVYVTKYSRMPCMLYMPIRIMFLCHIVIIFIPVV